MEIKNLSEFTDQELLQELLMRNPPFDGAVEIVWSEVPLEATIGIGKDNMCRIMLLKDDYEALGQIYQCPRCDGSGIALNSYGDMIYCPICEGTGRIKKGD